MARRICGRWRLRLKRRGMVSAQRLVAELERIALDRGWTEIALASRETATGFYVRLGYVPKGDVYERIGITHVNMRKRLGPGI